MTDNPQHVNPGLDTTINPIVIDDSYREKQMEHDIVCASEDFCKGCGNFDAFFNSCKLTVYQTRFSGKKEKVHPKTNGSRWLLDVVGCASDTRRSNPALELLKTHVAWLKETSRNQLFDAYAIGKMIEEAERRAEGQK